MTDAPRQARSTAPPWVLAVHGGAGDAAARLPARRLAAAREAMVAALNAGRRVLFDGGGAVDAVVAAVAVLEDDPEFNAGRGSALTVDASVEMDAGVADGNRRRAGAVGACRRVRNPVEAARAVMERTDHVLMVGEAVTASAERWGLALAPEDWFVTPRALEQLRRGGAGATPSSGGTVGAVARDVDGHLAAATSTGGSAGQLTGRVGDTPVIGAGTWADDATCAVSATGRGEAFVLAAFAHEVDARVRLGGAGILAACEQALDAVSARGGRGGCVAIDGAGTVAMPFTTAAMFRGRVDATGEMVTAVLPPGQDAGDR